MFYSILNRYTDLFGMQSQYIVFNFLALSDNN